MKKTFVVTFLRMLIGWHFLYEGLWKLIQPGGWSAMGYLKTSQWFAAPLFHYIAETPSLLRMCDLMNMWGLTLIGLALFLGVLIRPAAFFGIVLLAFYYIAQPPFLAATAEGHYLWIDRNAVEAVAMLVVLFLPSYSLFGWLVSKLRKRSSDDSDSGVSQRRRELLMSLTSLPILGVFSYAFYKKHGPVWERENLKGRQADAVTSATVKT